MNAKRSLWIGTTEVPHFEPLRDGTHVDVAIVGAGITGLTAAVLLKERGKRVAVIDKERIASGETGHTTAHITEAIDARYFYVARAFNKETARLVAQASRASIQQIAELVERFAIQCHLKRVPGYLYTEKRSAVAELKKEAIAAAEAGLATRFVEEVPLPFPTRGAVLFENQAQFHPREYLIALAKRIPGDGSFVFDTTHVTSIREGDPCVVETEAGSITAKTVFQATNAPIVGFTALHTKDAAYRTYALAYRVEGAHPDGLFWDTADPYHYTRWQETDRGTYLIIGGEDHKTGQKEESEESFAALEAYAVEKFGVRNPEYRWSGQVLDPVDGLPYIGGNERMYTSTGYAGQGITFGTVGGMIVADLVMGRPNPWAEIFDAHRKHMRGAVKDYVTENVDFPRRFIADRIFRRDVEGHATGEVSAGEGKILSVSGKKVAVYRDEEGAVHTISPICTHLRCDVAWNGAEKSWDCPCHGSRFRPDGSVLNGPARDPLAKIDLEED